MGLFSRADDHQWSQQHLSAYASGDLSPRARRRLERHAEDCADCGRGIRALRALAGLAAGAAGAAAAGTGAVVLAEKVAVGRVRLRPDPAAGEPLDHIGGEAMTVFADDSLPLHVEVTGPKDAPVTIIFCHGYAASLDAWYYQHAGLEHSARLVFWDQRSHGRSGRSEPGLASIDQLGADLHQVLMATAPDDMPVVLVGHSMGGMTVMALADQHPELFGSKVIGAVLISTAASTVDTVNWLPGPLRPALRRAMPSIMTGASKGRFAGAVERSRQSASDLAFVGTRWIAFGDSDVRPEVVDFLERIIRATPIGVLADFCVAMIGHEKRHALKVLGIVPVLVLTGDRDRVVDPACSDEIASAIPDAELVTIHGAGHAVILERPEHINEAIAGLAAKALAHEAERRELTRKQSHVRRRDTGPPVTGGHAHDKKDSARRAAGLVSGAA
jgi:pimeloyl-ACP methyl ester carboxylesterase